MKTSQPIYSAPEVKVCEWIASVIEKGRSLKTEYDDEFVDTSTAANYLRISKQGLLNKVSQGGIKHYKFGRLNRYRIGDLRELLLANRRGPKGDEYGI